AREESSERIAAHEKPKALPFAEMQNAHCRHVQVVFARLQKLVPRIRAENVDERLARMTAGSEARARDDIGGLVSQQRNFSRLRAVGGRSVEAEKAMLSANLAGPVEPLDTDVIEIAGAVHRRARIRLGDGQNVG